jgi:hypothetical protein
MNPEPWNPEPPSGSAAPDWMAHLQRMQGVEKFSLAGICTGDVLLVATDNTRYRIEVRDAAIRKVWVLADREDRPSGDMTLHGCTFGASSTIAPEHLFCGGNLELGFLSPDGTRGKHTTSQIHKVVHVRRTH